MKIRSKLAWTYIILLIIGIITISAYSILTIRAFLLNEGIREFERDVQAIAIGVGNFSDNDTFSELIHKQSELTGYSIAVYDQEGIRIITAPDSVKPDQNGYLESSLQSEIQETPGGVTIRNEPASEKLRAYVELENSANAGRYLSISQDKSQYYAAASSIRHIIYGGMFFSIGAVIIVSFLFARYMASPILQLNDAALDIARGNLDREIDLSRNDEFGTLADSLNHMAENLKSDNEELKRLNQKQSQFFADITHEVRNPLHTIAGALEMLEVKALSADKKTQYIQTAQKQIRRVTRLFEDIKTLQRYDFDKTFLHKSEFDLSIPIQEVFNAYLPKASKKGLNLIIDKKEPCFVYADPDKIEQVLENLVSNAIKYTPKGKVNVGYKLKNQKVQVYIKDTGSGIGKEHLDRLFDRFYRTDKARSRDKGGTGLGLAVVKGILNAHGSEIKVESTVGEGSKFHFELPVVRRKG